MKANELRIGNCYGYKVSEIGEIFNKDGKRINQRENDKGYPCVSLWINGKSVYRRVHRIVAEVFIPNPDNKPQVNHLDMNRSNPNVNNLEWCTASENVIHSVKNGGRKGWTRDNTGINNPNKKHQWKTICAIRELYLGGDYSQNDLSMIFGIEQGRISKIVNNEIWKSKN